MWTHTVISNEIIYKEKYVYRANKEKKRNQDTLIGKVFLEEIRQCSRS